MTMRLSLISVEVEGEGEWVEQKQLRQKKLQKHVQKAQVGVKTKSSPPKQEKKTQSKYIFPICLLPITPGWRQRLVRNQCGRRNKGNCV